MNSVQRTNGLIVLALCVALAACGKKSDDSSPAAASPATAASDAAGDIGGGKASQAPSGSACALLTTAEVASALPGAGDGENDDSRQEYGIAACEWATPHGLLFAQRWTLTGSSARQEASGLALGVLDPMKGAALRSTLRFETAAGIGDDAVIVIEAKDEARGVLEDIATLVARRGDQWVILGAPDLAQGDRAAAIATLTALGRNAAGRL